MRSFYSNVLIGPKPVSKMRCCWVADEQIPGVHQELHALDNIFAEGKTLFRRSGHAEVLRQNSNEVDVIHLACHAQFRSDNPLFSSLKLAMDGLRRVTPMD